MKNLNIVVGRTAKGDLKVVYLGTVRSEAQDAMAKAVADGKMDEVLHARNIRGRLKRPRRMKDRKELFALEAEAIELPGAIAEARETVDGLREALAAAEAAQTELPKDATDQAKADAKAVVDLAVEELDSANAALADLEKRRLELVKLGLIEADPDGD